MQTAKAGLQGPSESNAPDANRLGRLARAAKSALATAHGSGQAAAIEMGIDQSQVNRQLLLGTFEFRQLAMAGDKAIALFGQNLAEEFGEAKKSRKQLAREVIPQMVQAILALTEEE